MKPTPYLSLTLAGICFGIILSSNIPNMGLAQPQAFIQDFINQSIFDNYNKSLTEAEVKLVFGVLAATHYVFAIPGSMLTQYVCNRFGRRITIFGMDAVFTILSAACSVAAKHTNLCELLFLSRVFYGFSAALYIVAMPTYVSEVVPPFIRGTVSSFITVFEQLIVVLLFVVGLPELMGTAELWPYIPLLSVPPCILQFVFFFFVPESPKWLYLNMDKKLEAMEVVQKLYGTRVQISSVQKAYRREREQFINKLTLATILKDPALRTSLLLATALSVSRLTNGGMILQQFAFIMFTDDLGFSDSTANYLMAGLMALMTLAALLGMVLIDRAGRRPLVLFGLFGNAFLALLYVVSGAMYEQSKEDNAWGMYVSLFAVVALMCNFSACLTMVTLFTVGELTAQAARPATTSFSAMVSMVLRIIYFFIFPILQVAAGVYTNIILISVPSIAIAIYLAIEMPETKKRPVEEVVDQIIRRKSSMMSLSTDLKLAHDLIAKDDTELKGLKKREAKITEGDEEDGITFTAPNGTEAKATS